MKKVSVSVAVAVAVAVSWQSEEARCCISLRRKISITST